MAKKKRRPEDRTAIVPVPPSDLPAHLTKDERHVLAEALRRGEDLADEVEDKVSSYGRWLLSAIFDDDAAKALDERTENPVWLELTRRAGGPSMPLSRRMLYVSLELAARDKRIADSTWRRLDAGRKELLLPLHDDRRLREAAHHVASFNLSQAKTREYVTSLLAEDGKKKQVRLTQKSLVARVRKMREGVGNDVLRKVRTMARDLDTTGRRELTTELGELVEALRALEREIRGK